MSGKSGASKGEGRVLSQAECLRIHHQRHASAAPPEKETNGSTVSEPVEDAILFMVHYLQEVQGPKYVVGRDIASIAATPEARRLFLSTAKYLLLQILREAELTVTNFHDLLCLMCPDFQIRVVKSAFKAAWVVLRERPRSTTPRLPFDKFWKALELTWLYEPYFLSVRRYIFDSDSHRVKLSGQVKQAVGEIEEYIRREGWPAVPQDIMKDAVMRASTMHGDTAACHFDGIVRALCVSDHLRHHIKMDNNATNLAARQAAGAAAQALTDHMKRRKASLMARQAGEPVEQMGSMDRAASYGSFGAGSLDRSASLGSQGSGSPRRKAMMMARQAGEMNDQLGSLDRTTSYGSFGGASLDRTASIGSQGSASPRSQISLDVKQLHSSGSSGSPASVASSSKEAGPPPVSAPAQGGGGTKPALRGIIPVSSDARGGHSPADSVSEISAGREMDNLKIAVATISDAAPPAVAEIQPCE